MADWPLFRQNSVIEDDTPLASYSVTVTPGASNVKGAYAEVVASLARSCTGIMLSFTGTSGAYCLFDIAVGGAGSEQVIVSNCQGVASTVDRTLFIPIGIRAGSRVSVRCQTSNGTGTLAVKMVFISDTYYALQPIQRWLDWGTTPGSTSFGASITAGSANVKGAYVQLVASSDFTTKWLMALYQRVGGAASMAYDIAVGGAGSEQVVIPNLLSVGSDLGLIWGPFPFSIPAGSRISARMASPSAGLSQQFYVMGGA